MNLIVFFRNKAVADGAVSFYLDRCVAVRIATSTFGIECLTSFNEEDLEHIARSDKAIIRPSGRVVLPDYFDVILKKVSWCCVSQPTSSRLTLSSHRAPACPRRLNFGDRIMWNPQFPSGREPRKSCAIVAAEKIQSGLISSHVRKNARLYTCAHPSFADNYTPVCSVVADTSSIPEPETARHTPDGLQYYRKEFDIILLFGMTELKAQLAWTEDVSFWFFFLPIKLTRGRHLLHSGC